MNVLACMWYKLNLSLHSKQYESLNLTSRTFTNLFQKSTKCSNYWSISVSGGCKLNAESKHLWLEHCNFNFLTHPDLETSHKFSSICRTTQHSCSFRDYVVIISRQICQVAYTVLTLNKFYLAFRNCERSVNVCKCKCLGLFSPYSLLLGV